MKTLDVQHSRADVALVGATLRGVFPSLNLEAPKALALRKAIHELVELVRKKAYADVPATAIEEEQDFTPRCW